MCTCSLARYFGLESPQSEFFFWNYITFQVTELDQNNKPTQKTTAFHGNIHTFTLHARQGTKLLFKVRNNAPVPSSLFLRIRAQNRTDHKTITLEKKLYKELVCISCDCYMEIVQMGLSAEIECREYDKFLFQVIGMDQPPVLTESSNITQVSNAE